MSINCEFSFPTKVFYAGQILAGSIKLTSDVVHSIRGVYCDYYPAIQVGDMKTFGMEENRLNLRTELLGTIYSYVLAHKFSV